MRRSSTSSAPPHVRFYHSTQLIGQRRNTIDEKLRDFQHEVRFVVEDVPHVVLRVAAFAAGASCAFVEPDGRESDDAVDAPDGSCCGNVLGEVRFLTFGKLRDGLHPEMDRRGFPVDRDLFHDCCWVASWGDKLPLPVSE